MTEISDNLEKLLVRYETHTTLEEFQSVVVRLLDRGIIVSDDSATETTLYLIANRVAPFLTDYFSITGCTLVHDRDFRYFRLYPPGSLVPGQLQIESEHEGALSASLQANVVSAALILRFLYGKALQQGKLDDDAQVHVSMEEFFTTLQTLLKRELKTKNERKETFAQLRAMRVIRYSGDEEIANPDAWMVVRPMITGLVSESALDAILDSLDPATGTPLVVDEKADETDAAPPMAQASWPQGDQGLAS